MHVPPRPYIVVVNNILILYKSNQKRQNQNDLPQIGFESNYVLAGLKELKFIFIKCFEFYSSHCTSHIAMNGWCISSSSSINHKFIHRKIIRCNKILLHHSLWFELKSSKHKSKIYLYWFYYLKLLTSVILFRPNGRIDLI